MFAVK